MVMLLCGIDDWFESAGRRDRISCQYLGYKQFGRHCDICKDLGVKIPAIHSSNQKLDNKKAGPFLTLPSLFQLRLIMKHIAGLVFIEK
jgi:hypothetical protein